MDIVIVEFMGEYFSGAQEPRTKGVPLSLKI